ncbi:MAG: TnpV protein [Oscillospiraceae bacterium]|nr:TnpV protein [Oscillospiraceae bacterium]
MMKSLFEEMCGTYTKVNGYFLPDLTLPDDGLGEEVYIGILGMRRLDYLKKHKKVLYSQLLMSGKLRAHLHEIDTTARERGERMIEQMMKAQGVTEQVKAQNQMRWVGLVNQIRACADEIIREELIYD